jgi:hypothetical protein
MYHRSLLGLAMLLLAASCVPPRLAGPIAAPSRGGARMLLPPLERPVLARTETLPVRAPAPAIMPASLSASLASATAAPPFESLAQDDGDARRSLECLTAAVYYEARSEPLDGQRAVAQVVLNRVRNPAYPSSVCGVVYQGSERRTGCQFTFACDGSMAYRREPAAWETAQQVAQAALAGSVYAPVGSATNYHADAIQPWWASSLTKVAAIGSQIFYKVSGAIGNALAFRQPYSGVEPGIATGVRAAAASPPATTGTPALVRYSLAGGASVAVYRGGAVATAAALVTSPVAGVHVHFGTTGDSPDEAPEASASAVTVHRGPAPGAAPAPTAATAAPRPSLPAAPDATLTASAADAGSTPTPPAG